MIASGGVATEYQGRPVIRHFGDPAAEYRAATEEAAVFDRSHRGCHHRPSSRSHA